MTHQTSRTRACYFAGLLAALTLTAARAVSGEAPAQMP